MKNIVLTGFMASGKTHIGKQLAKKTGFSFVDTDALVVEDSACSINEIFASQGEATFRDLETAAVRKAAAYKNAVIATGGGAVLRKENVQALRETGVIVCLDIPENVLLARMAQAAGERPLMQTDTQAVLDRLHARAPYYADCDLKITVSDEKTPAEHADEILKMLDF